MILWIRNNNILLSKATPIVELFEKEHHKKKTWKKNEWIINKFNNNNNNYNAQAEKKIKFVFTTDNVVELREEKNKPAHNRMHRSNNKKKICAAAV